MLEFSHSNLAMVGVKLELLVRTLTIVDLPIPYPNPSHSIPIEGFLPLKFVLYPKNLRESLYAAIHWGYKKENRADLPQVSKCSGNLVSLKGQIQVKLQTICQNINEDTQELPQS